jgi:hypothetical protein
LNRRIEVLQTSALPLGYRALPEKSSTCRKKIPAQALKSQTTKFKSPLSQNNHRVNQFGASVGVPD